MPVQITINGADASETLTELFNLSSGFKNMTAQTETKTEDAPKRSARTSTKTETVKPQKEEAPNAEQDKPEASEDGTADIPTDVELRAAATAKAKSAGREKVKALLDKYEVGNVTALSKDKRVAFMQELEGLE